MGRAEGEGREDAWMNEQLGLGLGGGWVRELMGGEWVRMAVASPCFLSS